jgi:zinc D-Ala-D-Ala carboxypeptidase
MKRTMLNIILLTIIFYAFSVTKAGYVLSNISGTMSVKGYNNSNFSKLVENPSEVLVLVNKTNVLNQGYAPKDLRKVNAPSIYNDIRMRKEAADSIEKMINSAQKSGVYLYCLSGYRSYNLQSQLYNQRLRQRGRAYTESYIAKPGSSEHQTGLAIDITNKPAKGSGIPEKFGFSKEGKWLEDNSYKFGFILRYPKGKENTTKYNYEPWHFRYVGVADAKQIKSSGIVLEEYLIKN